MKVLIKVQLSPHKYKTPEGYLICEDSVLARTGKQSYMKCELYEDCAGDQTIIDVDRKPEQVFAPETLASFENKPLTLEHPDENVTPENFKYYAIGLVRDVHKGEYEGQEVMLGTIVVTDAEAIELIESGEMKDLSCGYDCDITAGDNPEQINIRGNHVALCMQGRAGIAKIIDSIDNNERIKETLKDADPKEGESKSDFISRFMEETKDEYDDPKQRLAVAYSYWNKAHLKDELVAGAQYLDKNNNVWEITNIGGSKITLSIGGISDNILDINIINSLIEDGFLKASTMIQDDIKFNIQFEDIIKTTLKPEKTYIDGDKIIAQFASENDALNSLKGTLLYNIPYDIISDENAYYMIFTNEDVYTTYTSNKLRNYKGKDSLLQELTNTTNQLIKEYGKDIKTALEKYLNLPENKELVWKSGFDIIPDEIVEKEYHPINEHLAGKNDNTDIVIKTPKIDLSTLYNNKEAFDKFIEWYKKPLKDNDKFVIYQGDNGWFGTKLSNWNKQKLSGEEVINLTRFSTTEEIIKYLIDSMGITKDDILIKIDSPNPKKDSVKFLNVNSIVDKINKTLNKYVKNFGYEDIQDAFTTISIEKNKDYLNIIISSDTLDFINEDYKLLDELDLIVKPYDSYFDLQDEFTAFTTIDLEGIKINDSIDNYEELKTEYGKKLYRIIKRLNLVENKDFEIQENPDNKQIIILTHGEFNHNLIQTILIDFIGKSIPMNENFDSNENVGKIIIDY